MSTETITRPVEHVDQSFARTWSLIAHNDDVTPAILVTIAFAAVGLPKDVAMAKTMEVHNTGSAVVKSGLTKEDATKDHNIILAITRAGGRFPGIELSFVEDI